MKQKSYCSSNQFLKIFITVFSILAFINLSLSQTTIVNYDFNTGSSYPTLSPALASGITCTASSTEVYASNGGIASGGAAFTSNSTAGNDLTMTNSSGTNTKYFQFSLGGSSLSNYNTFRVYFQGRRSGTGAQVITVQYSLNGGAYTNFTSNTMSPGNGSFVEATFNLPVAVNNPTTSLEFRLFASGASGSGTLRLDNFQIQAVNAPATSTVLITAQDPNTPTAVNWALGSNFNQFYWAAITPSITAATLNSVTANMTGNYVTSDIATNGFKLYYSSDFTFIPAGDVLLGQQSSSTGNGETIAWTGLTQNFVAGTTGYIYATADITSTATVGNTLAGSFTGDANIVFSPTVTYSTSNTYGSTTNKIFASLPTNPATFSVTCSSEAGIKVSMNAPTSGTVLVFANTGTTYTTPTGLGTSFTGANNSYALATNYTAVGGRLVYSGAGSNFTVTGLTSGQTYSLIAYSYDGSNWSSGTSVITGTSTTQPVTATVVTPSSGQLLLTWTNPPSTACNNNVIVIASQGSPVEAAISKGNFDGLVSDADFTGANNTWTLNSNANDVYDLTLTLLGTDNTNFLVYKGTGNSVTLNGLTDGTPYFFRIFTVDGNASSARWSAAVDATGTPNIPGYYWNGGSISNIPAAGGTGTWGLSNGWRQPGPSGAQANWADGNAAIFAGTTGVVTLDANRSATGYSFNTTSYTLQTTSSTAVNLTGPISIGTNLGLVLAPNFPSTTFGTIGVGTINGSGSASVTIYGNPASSIENNRVNLAVANSTINVPTNILTTTGIGMAGYVSTSVGGVINGNITNNSSLRTMIGATIGNDLIVNGIISGSSGLQISAGASGGAGRITFNNSNTYAGQTVFNAANSGTIVLGTNNAFPNLTNVTMAFSGSNGGILDMNGFNQTIGNIANNTGGGSITNNSSSNNSTLTITQSTLGSFNRPITDGSLRRMAISNSGTSTLTLNGTGYNFSGGLYLNAGELRFNPSSSAYTLSSCPVVLNSGIFGTNGISASSVINFSTIALSNNSEIKLEALNSHTLSFAASSAVPWTASRTLTITGWQGTYTTSAGSPGTVGQIFVGTTSSGLTSSQLNQIRFFDGTNYYGAILLSNGELVPRCSASITAISSNTPCENAALNLSVTTTVLPSIPSFSLSYSWVGPNSFASSVQNPTITSIPFSGAGIYTVTASNVCSSATSTLNVTVIQTPTLVPISSFTVCGGKNVAALNFTTNPVGQSTSWFNTNTAIGLGASGSGNLPAFTSSLVTSAQMGVVQVTPFTGGCIGSSINFNITVNGPQASTIWTGAVSTSFFDPDNWTNCVCAAITDATIAAVTSPSFNPVITSTANVNSLTIDPSASLSISTNQTLNVNGDWTNNGSFDAQSGLVNFIGTSAQTINGASTNTFYDVTQNNSNGLILSANTNVRGTLLLTSGTLSSGNNLTLMADAAGSGRIGPISSAADITGNVNVQQYAQPGATGWAFLGSPVTSGLTINDWNDDFAITCPACTYSTVGGTPFTSIYSYDETVAATTYSDAAKYIAINAPTDPINHGVGYWVWLGDGNTNGIMFDTQGSIAKSNCSSCGSSTVSIGITKSTNNGGGNDGWNLISNPLPSPISFSLLVNGNPNVNPTLYAYNTDLNSGSGAMATYVPATGVSAPSIGSGGIGDAIPMCQGFYVEATGNTSLLAGENIKVASNQAFLKSTATNTLPLLRLFMNSSSGNHDEIALCFINGATTGFDGMYDARKFISDASYPSLAAMSGTNQLNISALPSLQNMPNQSVPLNAITPSTGVFTFSLSHENFTDGICLELIDNLTNVTTNILTTPYTCTLYDTTTFNRFTLSFKTIPMAGITNVTQPNCVQSNHGSIVASGSVGAPWNYVWKNSSNVIVKTTLNTSGADSLVSLTGGSYFVSVNSLGTCNTFTQSLTINPVVLPISQFSASADTVYLASGAMVSFNNSSSNATNYNWNFGDGNTSSIINPINTYSNVGVYYVTLQATSSTFCSDSSSQTIVVLSYPVGIKSLSINNSIVLQNHNFDDYSLNFKLSENDNVTLVLSDVNGKVVLTKMQKNISVTEIPISLKDVEAGVYLLNVKLENKQENKVFKLIKY
jgi:hypothetical protein